MEDEKQQQIINERFAQLPVAVQNAITDSDWRSKIRFIVDKNNLLLDQGLAIETETFLMMLGISDAENYAQNIKESAQIGEELAIEIASEVDEQILKEIRNKIIEESEEMMGANHDPLNQILGLNKDLEAILPSTISKINTKNKEVKTIRPDVLPERDSLIKEIGGDIKIDDDLTIEEDPLEFFEKSGLTNIPSKTNTIPTENFKTDKSRVIETETSYSPDNLPTLEPIRTFEKDTKQKEGFDQNQNIKLPPVPPTPPVMPTVPPPPSQPVPPVPPTPPVSKDQFVQAPLMPKKESPINQEPEKIPEQPTTARQKLYNQDPYLELI